MTTYEIARRNYLAGHWTDAMLARLVAKAKLSEDEMNLILAEGETSLPAPVIPAPTTPEMAQAVALVAARSFLTNAMLKTVAESADLSDNELNIVGKAGLLDSWQPGEIYPANKRLSHDGITYVVMQEVTAQEHQPPGGTGMLAVYRPVGVAGEAEADGSPEHPYTLVAGMEGVAGKYYRHADKLWECLRDMQNIIESWLPGSPGMETFWREVQPAAAALSAPAPAEEPSPIAASAQPASPVVPVVDAPMAVDTPAPAEDSRGVVAAPIPVSAAERYFLNSSRSTYHMLDCDDAQTGSLRTLDYIAQNHAATARPCAKCNPPALAV